MGGGHSVSSVQRSLTNVVTRNVVNAVQSVSLTSGLTQALLLDCEKTALATGERYVACLEFFKEHEDSKKYQILVCEPILEVANRCTIHNVDMKQIVNVDLTASQYEAIDAQIETSLDKRMESDLKVDLGMLNFGSDVTVEINSLASSTAEILNEHLQEALTKMESKQIIKVVGGTVGVVSMTQVQDVVSAMLQKDSSWSSLLSKLSESIVLDYRQQTAILRIAFIVGGAVIGLAILLAIVIYALRKKRSKK